MDYSVNYLIMFEEGPDVIIENVAYILNETDEVIFKDASDEVIGIFSKNSYKAIVAEVNMHNNNN